MFSEAKSIHLLDLGLLVHIFINTQIPSIANNIKEDLLFTNFDITPSKLLSLYLIGA